MALPNMPQSPDIRRTITIDAAGCTAVGQARDRNEDQFMVATLGRAFRILSSSVAADDAVGSPYEGADASLLIVADGMGGHGGGDIASAVAVRSAADYLRRAIPDLGGPLPRNHQDSLPGVRSGLASAVRQGDQDVKRAAHDGGALGMGTTLTIALLCFPRLYVAHVGDSRCYLMRDGTLFRMTNDHTVAEQMRAFGNVDPDSEWHHVLTRAVGGGDNAETEPEIRRAELMEGDLLLLCSDGVTKHLDDDDITLLLNRSGTAAELSRGIVTEANARGGSDNITAVVARCLGARG